MDRKQKERLRFYLKARRRADIVLAKRRQAEQEKREHSNRIEANRLLQEQYTRALTALAEQSGIVDLADQAARQHGGVVTRAVSCYVDYGISSSAFQRVLLEAQQGQLRASHLSLFIRWEEVNQWNQVEIRVRPNGQITFSGMPLPVLAFVWRRSPRLLQFLLTHALAHPIPMPPPADP